MSEADLIQNLNLFFINLTSSKTLDIYKCDKSHLKVKNLFLNPRLDYISITTNHIKSLLQLEETKFAIVMSDNKIIIIDLEDISNITTIDSFKKAISNSLLH